MTILVINAGSSSHKAALFSSDWGSRPQWRSHLDWSREPGWVHLSAQTADGRSHRDRLQTQDPTLALRALIETLWQGPAAVVEGPTAIAAVGHRVVHGGTAYQHSVVITPDVKATIRDLCPLAPAHNPANLHGIEVLETLLSGIPQVAVFDTAFHSHLPRAAATYAGPYDWLLQGIRRYGFHGISHQYVAQRAADLLQKPLSTLNLVTCHLGNGCSLAAIRGGVSVDTTMGFTPLEGLMMGSRSGSVDPGIVLHLLRQGDLTATDLDRVLNQGSGLRGISGLSNDLRTIIERAEAGHDRAKLALEMFIHSLRRHLGAMLASLDGLDAVVFTAGIGENSPLIWQAACEPWQWLGLRLDPAQLERCDRDRDIAAPDSTIRVLIIHTQEEWAIAQACQTALANRPAVPAPAAEP